MLDKVKQEVFNILKNDQSGHGMDHIKRVFDLSLKLSENEHVNKDIVRLIALLHDVDDYKLFGEENADNLTNAKRIMEDCNIDEKIQNQVCLEIKRIGYSKYLKGIRPQTIEGKIVSDADMCDALGAHGILRCYAYSMKINQPFFNKDIFPIENITSDVYTSYDSSSVNHIFEKILKLKDLMLTREGKKEAMKRHQIVIDFLNQYFDEENANEWKEYLSKYRSDSK